MTEAELDEIEARAAAATPGPWRVVRHDVEVDQETLESVTVTAEPEDTALYCSIHAHGQTHEVAQTSEEQPNPPDAAFIAAARQDVPALCKALRAERADNERLCALLDEAESVIREYVPGMTVLLDGIATALRGTR